MSLNDAGYSHALLGNYQEAISYCERSHELCRELADRYNEADALDHLGGAHKSAGDFGAAHWAWAQAVRVFDEINHPDGGLVRAKLRLRGERLGAGASGQTLVHRADSLV